MKLLLAWLFFSALAFANPNVLGDTTDADVPYEEAIEDTSKVLYLNFENIPQRVLKGEVFPITIKTLCVIKDFKDIQYKLSNMQGLKLLSDTPSRVKNAKFYYDTFYFIATSQNAKLPDFEATLVDKMKKVMEAHILAVKHSTLSP